MDKPLTLLCQLEEKLKELITELERHTGRKIRINGLPYDVYVRQQWDEYHSHKDEEKQQRVCILFEVFLSVDNDYSM